MSGSFLWCKKNKCLQIENNSKYGWNTNSQVFLWRMKWKRELSTVVEYAETCALIRLPYERSHSLWKYEMGTNYSVPSYDGFGEKVRGRSRNQRSETKKNSKFQEHWKILIQKKKFLTPLAPFLAEQCSPDTHPWNKIAIISFTARSSTLLSKKWFLAAYDF